MRSVDARGSSLHRTLLDFNNSGTIMNYKMTHGINDLSTRNSFRKWTGMPQETRQNKMPNLPLAHSRLVADHRKRALMSFEKNGGPMMSLESSMLGGSIADEPTRNISA